MFVTVFRKTKTIGRNGRSHPAAVGSGISGPVLRRPGNEHQRGHPNRKRFDGGDARPGEGALRRLNAARGLEFSGERLPFFAPVHPRAWHDKVGRGAGEDHDLGLLDATRSALIVQAAEEVMEGEIG